MKNNIEKLKGDFSERAIRVNHAGEYGAICIYSGQKLILKKSSLRSKIIEMEEQEKKHFYYFSEKIKERRIRPTVLLPIWYVSGVFLGIITAMMGKRTAMACTAAVENVIGEHYNEQILSLEDDEELREVISKFRDDELKHRDIAIHHNAENAPCYNILDSFIKISCKTAIYLSKLI